MLYKYFSLIKDASNHTLLLTALNCPELEQLPESPAESPARRSPGVVPFNLIIVPLISTQLKSKGNTDSIAETITDSVSNAASDTVSITDYNTDSELESFDDESDDDEFYDDGFDTMP